MSQQIPTQPVPADNPVPPPPPVIDPGEIPPPIDDPDKTDPDGEPDAPLIAWRSPTMPEPRWKTSVEA